MLEKIGDSQTNGYGKKYRLSERRGAAEPYSVHEIMPNGSLEHGRYFQNYNGAIAHLNARQAEGLAI